MRIRADQLQTSKSVALEAGEKRCSEHGVRGVAHVDTEDLTVSLGGHARGNHDRSGEDLMVDARLDVGRV